MASSARSASISKSLPSISVIFQLPSPSRFHSTRTQCSFFSLPFSPMNSLVATLHSRTTPSSCEVDVRSLLGHSGQVSSLSSFSGGLGRISICITDSQPWRTEVPMQSEPVSPPPMTTTFLPVARMAASSGMSSPATRRFCWGRNSMAKCTPWRSRPGTGRSRGFSDPPVRATASKSSSSSAALMSTPTWVLGLNTSPSASICCMRRSM